VIAQRTKEMFNFPDRAKWKDHLLVIDQ
jgi:hypothetical protein